MDHLLASRRRMRLQPFLAAVVGLALLLLVPLPAQGQAHEVRQGAHVLRSSNVSSLSLDATTARAHGIEPAQKRAVLNVTLLEQRQGVLTNVPAAAVQATVKDLTGREREISMRRVVSNDMVSYIGEFEFLPAQTLRFEIVARPGSGGEPLKLSYEDRMRSL